MCIKLKYNPISLDMYQHISYAQNQKRKKITFDYENIPNA